jgi:hypothetical protein
MSATLRGGALQRVHQDQELHQVVVHRRAGRLHHENVHPADVLANLHVDFAVAEPLDLRHAKRDAEERADFLRQLDVGGSRKKLEPGHTLPLLGEIRYQKKQIIYREYIR